MDKIKLVIWDLDETFWKGTLSEEGIEKIDFNIKIIKELTSRGIINSVVSKNDFEEAKNKLIELGVWEYLVFPQIEWKPKGMLIKDIISKCQLRDNNVLFLDDNHMNLNEAKFYNPNIHAYLPSFIEQILNHDAFKGKDDKNHSRLKQYKILEKKYKESKSFSSNIEFLKYSEIRIKFISNLYPHANRIHELLDRTNQLNFTKKRLSLDEVYTLIGNQKLETRIIQVIDKYGDYGIVGLYSLNKDSNLLEHFVFSCRIINLGIAQYVYSKLGFPILNIVPDVSEKLDKSTPSWITEYSNDQKIIAKEDEGNITKIFFKGGCDLGQMLYYLGNNNFNIVSETNYVNKDGFPIHQEHTQILLDSLILDNREKDWVFQNIPFTDSKYYSTDFFSDGFDCVIYSLLMDYTQDMYQSINNKRIKLPLGGYGPIWTDIKNHKLIFEQWNKRGVNSITMEKLKFFANEFEHIGQITSNNFYNNLMKIREKLPLEVPIIFVNGAEIESPNNNEKLALERHREMNTTLDKFINNSENTFLLDLREIVLDKSQLQDSIRHYNRETYKTMAINLLGILNQVVDNRISQEINMKSKIKLKLLGKDALQKFKKLIK